MYVTGQSCGQLLQKVHVVSQDHPPVLAKPLMLYASKSVLSMKLHCGVPCVVNHIVRFT